MNKKLLRIVIILVVSVCVLGCATTSSSTTNTVNIPSWEKDQENAILWFLGTEISTAQRILRQNINNANEAFSYSGKLYNEKLKADNAFNQFRREDGLTITDFPRQGSTDHVILWACINDFRRQTGASPGDYFWISIFTANYMDEVILKMEFLGRFEANESIRGWMYRRP